MKHPNKTMVLTRTEKKGEIQKLSNFVTNFTMSEDNFASRVFLTICSWH